MSETSVFIHGIATRVPAGSLSQDKALEFMLRHVGDTPKKQAFLNRLYKATAIEKRHSVLGDFNREPGDYDFFPNTEDLEPQPSTAARNAVFVTEAEVLALEAVRSLLADLPAVKADDITHLITVSCTGFSAPGFDFTLVRDYPLSRSVHRFNLGFMGCFAAFPALKLANYICQAEPSAKVLIVNAELCTLHFQAGFVLDNVVANSLFADGVTATLVSARREDSQGSAFAGRALRLHRLSSSILPSSEKDMAWIIGETGFDMRLSAYVPEVIRTNIDGLVAELFAGSGWTLADIEQWAVHPGGRAILDKLSEAFGVTHDDFQFSYNTLRDYGNMSSATVFFVLRALLESGRLGKTYSAAFGPGLTVESALLELVP